MHITKFYFTAVLGLCASFALAAPVNLAAGSSQAQEANHPPPTGQPGVARNIVLRGVPYSLLKEIVIQEGLSRWTLSDSSLIARQFKTSNLERKQAFDLARQRIVDLATSTNFQRIPRLSTGGLAIFGQSQINGQGEESSWILERSYNGKHLRQGAPWEAAVGQGRRACRNFLSGTVALKLVEKMLVFYEQTGLIHLYPDQHNTLWSEDGQTILGFIGQEHLYKPESPEFETLMRDGNHGSQPLQVKIKATIVQFARKFRIDHYPDDWCPISGNISVKQEGRWREIRMPRPNRRA